MLRNVKLECIMFIKRMNPILQINFKTGDFVYVRCFRQFVMGTVSVCKINVFVQSVSLLLDNETFHNSAHVKLGYCDKNAFSVLKDKDI